MKQLLILSGKGGTGKTTVASAFIKLSEAKKYADCDVDAPNLHLLMGGGREPERKDYYGMPKASIDSSLCTRCDACRKSCRFDAIGADYRVDAFSCEGCGVCRLVCPCDAVSLIDDIAGELMLYELEKGAVFSTARLNMGSGTSGKLVAEVKKQLRQAKGRADFAVIDGSPGIGCPVIASISGADTVLIVAEPSVSGLSDMDRIIKTAEVFKMKIAVCTNKWDTNTEISRLIEEFCQQRHIPFVGRIPFDGQAVKAINAGLSITDIDCQAGRAVRKVYENLMEILSEGKKVERYDSKGAC